ncbi:unnamed protein product [Acanthoscelides obtectus]|uniref:Uncharacterized protein n=1 Tax=Acanthoscelides obtectus TaxID=200917 RepID=A0A9P0P111_ACAOB|nr:unnamed protein product [Acanthoscelides obtectus]CAK1663396.1 hypothetical protein AOBTE_LOCUS23648 [Acanthoscelides obtectus]
MQLCARSKQKRDGTTDGQGAFCHCQNQHQIPENRQQSSLRCCVVCGCVQFVTEPLPPAIDYFV